MEWLSNEERFSAIEDNLKFIREELAEAALKSGRKPEDVSLMAVTKTVESQFINHAIANGISADAAIKLYDEMSEFILLFNKI